MASIIIAAKFISNPKDTNLRIRAYFNSHKEAKMKGKIQQLHPYELRVARIMAHRISWMVARDVWFANEAASQQMVKENQFWASAELNVKESNRTDVDETASTVFTFRFEGGTVVRVTMVGHNDWNYGFQWSVSQVKVRFYAKSTDSAYPSLASPKNEVVLNKEYFWEEDWMKKPLPVK